MQTYSRDLLLRGAVGLLCVLSPALTSTAWAQNAQANTTTSTDPDTGAKLKEVTVTARRYRENEQVVPISLTTYSGAALSKEDIRTANDLDKNIPGLSICCSRGATPYTFIRGVPGVVGYFAGVPTTLDSQALYFDLGNVQVLKGPQGTLFGLSSNGGAILFEPQRPSFKSEAYVQLATGNQGRAQVEGVANVVLSDKMAMRVGGAYDHLNGDVLDLTTGRRYGEDNYKVGRIGILARPLDNLENYLVVNYFHSNGLPPLYVPYVANPQGPLSPPVLAGLEAELVQQAKLGWYTVPGTSFEGASGLDEQINAANITTWDLTKSLTIKNILGYSSVLEFNRTSTNGSLYPIYDSNIPPTQQPNPTVETSEELQLQGHALDRRLTYTLGTFHDWTGNGAPVAGYSDLRAAYGIISISAARNRGQTHAFYFEGTYQLPGALDKLAITAGVRHTKDERSLSEISGITFSPSAPEIVTGNFNGSKSWDATSDRFSLTYNLAPKTMLYLTDSKGYSSGGFNTTAPPQLQVYNPESLTNYELGIKSEWRAGDWAARTNFAAYYGRYVDIQVPVTSRVCAANGSNCTLAVVTQNAAEGRIQGLETELLIVPNDKLQLGFNGSWMEAKYTHYVSLNSLGQSVDLSSTQFVYTPKWKYNVYATYYLFDSDKFGGLALDANYSAQAMVYNTAAPNPQFYDKSPGFDNLDADLAWTDVAGHRGLSAWLFVTNLTDNHWANGQFGAYQQLGLWGLSVAEPRLYGVRVKMSFQ